MLSLDELVDIRKGSRAFAQGGFNHGDVEFQVIIHFMYAIALEGRTEDSDSVGEGMCVN